MLGEVQRWFPMGLFTAAVVGSALAQTPAPLPPVREQALIRMVRQDCGS